MIIFKFFLFFLSIILPGWLMEKLWLKSHRPFLFKLALAWGIGAALITLELFSVLFLLKLKLNLAYFYLFLILETALLFYLVIKNKLNFKLPELKSPKITLGQAVIFILILIQIIFLSLNALARPPIAYDNLTMWQYKPKVLFYENQINFNESQNTYLGGGGHVNYPWQAPLLSYWLYANIKEFNDLAGNFQNLVYYLTILILIYYFIKPYLSSLISLIFVWLFSTLPLPFYHAYNGYADLILSFYLLLGFMFLFYWIKKGDTGQLLASGVFFSCALFVKNEALIFIIAGLAIVLIKLFFMDKKFLPALKYAGYFLSAVILLTLPWLIFKIKYNLAFSNIGTGMAYHGEVLKNIYWAMFLNSSFNIWWFAAIVGLIFNFRKIKKQPGLLLGWLFLIFCLVGFILLYLFTEEYRFAVDNTALSRNLLTLMPISICLTAISFSAKEPNS